MHAVLKVVKWAMKVFFIVFFVFAISLFFRQQPLPDSLCRWIQQKASNADTVLHFEGLSFGFPNGLQIDRLRVFGLTRKNPLEPIVAAETVFIHPFQKKVKLVALRVPRLHDAYYEVGTVTEPVGENNGRFALPRLPEFDLELIRPEVLGVAPEVVTARVTVDPLCLDIHRIHLIWPDIDVHMDLNGSCTIDLNAMRVFGQVEGLAKQPHIRPMLGDYDKLVTLDVPVALPYFDAFTEVTKPVPASCAWDVNLINNEFTIRIRLDPELGRYNGVSLKRATGGVTIHVWWIDGKMQYATSIDVDSSTDHFGRTFGGHLTVFGTNDVRTVRLNAQSELKKDDALNIIGYLNNGLLDCFQCVTPPHVAVNGVLATRNEEQRLNDLHGRLTCEHAQFFGVTISNVMSRFDYEGDTIKFTGATARARLGGRLDCNASLSFPGYDDARATYDTTVDYRDGSIEELSDVFKFDPGRRHGNVSAHIHLAGMLFTNSIARLCGDGHVEMRQGLLAQMKLFAGLTELLADKVPGVAMVVNQSDASADFTLTDGVLTSQNIRIEGSVFSLSATGSYNMNRDELDFTVRVRFMKDDATPGLKELIRTLSWPFSKLLMEFKVTGSLNNPTWKYVSLLDRVL